MRKSIRTLATLSLLSLAPLTSHAVEVRGLFNVGYDFGGDRLVTTSIPMGRPISSMPIAASSSAAACPLFGNRPAPWRPS